MITLSSDFGTPYPAAMKGVVLQSTDARLVDVAHDFPRQDVRATAFWLREVLPYFPPAVHLVVVDPGVGTDRKAVVVRAGRHAVVAPDNGVAIPAARRLAEDVEVFEIEVEDPASSTFHGRDVFAPAAADVHERGVEVFDDYPGYEPLEDYATVEFPDPDLTGDVLRGEVLVVDGFGNAITNLPGRVVEDRFGDSVRVNRDRVRVEPSYAHVDPGERVVTVGSHGNVELAVNRGRGDDAFGVDPGSPVELSL
ncbi:S-adenosylmethionine hydroxide adenosyltransferase family protein [Halobacterium hubeiense]|uniref:S-adenosylmethionine hydroxide adenosyltransferase family protein n=1 Tax=Halobacterium hubeiense TaxID=1407499 RepID=A0A0U5AB81_9EURY|nr:SAM-dependent chlorinase/fluorinase [Halobacterium hubeiense]CQH48657.1 S-adenosylmethionine hydroxide adenosyltransferase family protein [Halobacterium hubeiense]